ASGGHGGGDEKLRRMIFEGGLPDPLGHQAGSFAGAVSILIGIAANKSIKEGRNIRINDLVPLDKYRG
ncbi:MAG: gfo/Idh/MocA family oxidoreductase, partial [bacterium]|nr:gfo/Idh/MocA family oxidoreductase [bacterium]